MNARSASGDISSIRTFDRESAWFSGHFPDYPVLPGIAQLAAVADMIQEKTGETVQVAALKRVKFKQIIHPDDTLDIQATRNPDQPDTYSFFIRVKNEIACQGIMTLRRKSNSLK